MACSAAGNRVLVVAVALTLTVAGVVVATAPASARPTGNNGVCEAWELCLWYDPNFGGSMLDMYDSSTPTSGRHFRDDISHHDDFFATAGRGRGTRVVDNAGSARNTDRISSVSVHSDEFCTGPQYVLGPGEDAPSLHLMRNDNESHCWW